MTHGSNGGASGDHLAARVPIGPRVPSRRARRPWRRSRPL